MTLAAVAPPGPPAPARRPCRLEAAVAAAGLFEGDRVLVLGTGAEAAVFTAAAAAGRSGQVVALLPDAARRASAEDRRRRGGWYQVRLVDGEAHRIPLRDGWADVIVGQPDAHGRAVTRELVRVLRPGGRIVLAPGPAAGTRSPVTATASRWPERKERA